MDDNKKNTTDGLDNSKKEVKDAIKNAPEFNLADQNDVKKLHELTEKSDEPVSIKIKNNEDDNVAFGVALPQKHPTPSKYLLALKEYNDSSQNIHEQIKLCRKLYEHEGIVGTVLDMYIDLSCANFKVKGLESEKARELIEHWRKNVNKGNNNVDRGLKHVVRGFSQEFYLNGNVFAYTRWNKTRVKSLKKDYKLPMTMVTIDPLIIEIPKESVQFGKKVMQINLDKVWGNSKNLSGPSKKDKSAILKALPTKIRHKAQKDKIIPLDPQEVYHIRRKGLMYAGWGIPYLTRAFNAIASKRKLRQLDDSTIDGLINSVTIFKIGDPNKPETFKASRLQAFSALMRQPTASLNLVWSWDVDVLHVSPKGDILDMANRYADVNRDILYALGIPVSLLTGQGEKAGDVWAAIVFITERLDEYKDKATSYLTFITESILEMNGFEDEDPEVEFIKPKLNSADLANVVLAFYDRGLISKETTDEEAGYDITEEHKRRIREKEQGIEDAMPRPDLPYAAAPKDGDENNQDNPKDPKDSGDPENPEDDNVQKPNPQTDDMGTPPTNKKKDTKISKVSTKPKDNKLKLEGNAYDRVEIIIKDILQKEECKSLATAKKMLNDVIKISYGILNGEELLGIPSNEFMAMSKFMTNGIKARDKAFREKMLDNLDRYFTAKK